MLTWAFLEILITCSWDDLTDFRSYWSGLSQLNFRISKFQIKKIAPNIFSTISLVSKRTRFDDFGWMGLISCGLNKLQKWLQWLQRMVTKRVTDFGPAIFGLDYWIWNQDYQIDYFLVYSIVYMILKSFPTLKKYFTVLLIRIMDVLYWLEVRRRSFKFFRKSQIFLENSDIKKYIQKQPSDESA